NAIQAADLDFIFYPEVTPANCTFVLATQRLARVQATGYGFPLSTGSPHMDYFIGGTEVESDGTDYSEQLILLPGMGVSTIAPPEAKTVRVRPYDDPLIRIVSSASRFKLNAKLLAAWESILSDRPMALLDMFAGMTHSQTTIMAPQMAKYLARGAVDLHPLVPRALLQETLVDADLYLDSFPFGGFNSLVEVLSMGCPVVTLEGNSARQRFGAAVLRRLDLPEFLIAKTVSDYIEAARRLIDDTGLRLEIRQRIGSRERVLAALSDPDLPHHFSAALEWMKRNGPSGPGKSRNRGPILIAAGEKPRVLCA
ncbi:MAG: hypothetical protein KDB61_13575, partial [Planctomycetes bacterium]|nr:hypothetical protein [Planctomycetota bacterium]